MKNSQPKKAVVTLCTGEKYEKIGELTHPGFRKYAERIGAEFVVINAPKLSNLGFHH